MAINVAPPSPSTITNYRRSRQRRAGIVYVPERYVTNALGDRRLVPFLEEWRSYIPGFFCIFSRRGPSSAALRVFIEMPQTAVDVESNVPPLQ